MVPTHYLRLTASACACASSRHAWKATGVAYRHTIGGAVWHALFAGRFPSCSLAFSTLCVAWEPWVISSC